MATSDVNKESTSVDDVILQQGSQESCESVNFSEVQINESVSTSVSTIKSDIDNKEENSDSCTDNTGRDKNTAKTERLIPLHFPKNVKDTSKPVNAKPSPKKCKKYGNQSVVWEPVLIKTEKDGKVTVTTGMKKTTESQPYVPKKSAMLYGSQSKSLNVSAQDAFNSPQSKMPVNTTLHTNVSSIRTSIEPLTKRYPHYLNPSVNKNLGRAIAEKKASIMKEISKVMKEAGTSKGLDMAVVGDTLKPGNTSVTNTQHTILKGNKRNSSKTVSSDCYPNEDSDDIKEDGKNLVSHNSNNDKSNMYLCGTVEENSLSSDTDSLQQLINSEPVKCITATPSAAKGREPIVPTAQEGTLAIPSAHIPSSVALLPCETSAVPCVLSNSSDNRSGTKKTKTKHFNNDRNNKKSNTVSQVKSKSQAKKTVSKRLQSDIPVKNKLNSRGSDLTIVSTSTSELERDLYTLSPPVKKQRLSAKTPPTAKLKSSEEKVQHNITKKKLTSVKSIHAPVSKDSSVVPTTPTVGKQIKKRSRINTVNKIGVPLVKNIRSATLKASVLKTKVVQSGAGRSKQVNSQKRSRNSLNDSTDILPLKSSPVLTPHEVISRITRAKTLKKNSTGIVKASGTMGKKGKQQTTKKQEELIISKKTDHKKLAKHKADNDKIVSPGIKKKGKFVTEKEGQLKIDEVSLVAQCSVNDIRNKRLEKIGGLCEEMPPTDPYIAFAPSECDILSKFIRETTEDIAFLTKDIEELAEKTCVSEYIDCETQTEAEVFLENEVDVNFEIPASTGHVLCRLCAGSFQRDALIALYGRVGSEKNLLPMINAVLPRSLKIIELDGLPQQVCLWCAEKLKSCYVILKSFMNADKTLRSVLYEQDSLHQVHNTNVQGSNNKNQSSPHSETSDVGEKMFTSPSQERHDTSASDFACKQKKKQVNSGKHSKETIASVEESVDNSESMKCIDLSRLDPEYHSGFEVEWCLDEEALRSCMVSVHDSKELSSEVSLSSKHDDSINTDINEDFGSSDHFAKTTYSSRVSLTKESSLDDNRDNLEDIFESYELEGKPISVTQAVQVPIEESDSSVLSLANKCLKGHLQFSNEVERIDDFPQETDEMECLQCQILFSSKSDALLHRVLHHRETVTTKSPKENSLEITCEGSNQEEDVHKSQNLPQENTQIPTKAS